MGWSFSTAFSSRRSLFMNERIIIYIRTNSSKIYKLYATYLWDPNLVKSYSAFRSWNKQQTDKLTHASAVHRTRLSTQRRPYLLAAVREHLIHILQTRNLRGLLSLHERPSQLAVHTIKGLHYLKVHVGQSVNYRSASGRSLVFLGW
jgi:hypothetical protein